MVVVGDKSKEPCERASQGSKLQQSRHDLVVALVDVADFAKERDPEVALHALSLKFRLLQICDDLFYVLRATPGFQALSGPISVTNNYLSGIPTCLRSFASLSLRRVASSIRISSPAAKKRSSWSLESVPSACSAPPGRPLLGLAADAEYSPVSDAKVSCTHCIAQSDRTDEAERRNLCFGKIENRRNLSDQWLIT